MLRTQPFRLNTFWGMMGAVFWTGTVLGVTLYANTKLTGGDLWIVNTLGSVIFVMYPLTGWALFVLDFLVEWVERTRLTFAINHNTLLLDKEIELAYEKRLTIDALSAMTNSQLAVANRWFQPPSLNITGNLVTWMVNGTPIPVWFVEIWYHKWQDRGGDTTLPADRDFQNDPDRDKRIAYNRAIREALIALQHAQNVGGPFAARFISAPKFALNEIGFWTALAIARTVAETEETEEGYE